MMLFSASNSNILIPTYDQKPPVKNDVPGIGRGRSKQHPFLLVCAFARHRRASLHWRIVMRG